MQETLQDFIDLLNLEPIEDNLFRGYSPNEHWQRVFGGQVIGQALMAAERTVHGRVCHSLHAYFLRPGDPKRPIIYEVDRSRDGRSFTSRRVVALQHGKQIFNMAASFQVKEKGLTHQIKCPKVPPPEDLEDDYERRKKASAHLPREVKKHFLRKRPIEMRSIRPTNFINPEKSPPYQQVWFRVSEKFPAKTGQALHQCALAYMSDMTLLDTCTNPHGVNWLKDNVQMASLDHAMWFHRPFRVDDWLLYDQASPSASGARGFNTAHIFNRKGILVASVTQEGLMRCVDKKNV